MKTFLQYTKDVKHSHHDVDTKHPNVNTYNYHRNVTTYKNAALRRGIYDPRRLLMVYRKNKLFNAKRLVNKTVNKLKESKLITFKELLEAFDPNKDVLHQYGNKKLISTVHSKERTVERHANETMVKDIFTKAVDHVKSNGNKYSPGDHLFVTSKTHNRSLAFVYRPDKFATNDKRSHFVHKSTMPEGNHRPDKRDKHIRVEGLEDNIEYKFIEVE